MASLEGVGAGGYRLGMAQETWTTRDLPVLDWLVEQSTVGDHQRHEPAKIAQALGMEQSVVDAALQRLLLAQPPYIGGRRSGQQHGLVFVTGVTERALVATGAWPGSDGSPARLAEALAALADREPEGSPERTRLQKAAAAVGSVGQAALNAAISTAVGAAMT